VVLVDTRVATIYMRPAMSVPLEVGPGRTILVRGGHAEVDDPSAMPTLLCDPRLTVELSERYRSHLPVWLETLEKQVRKPQAKVILPSGVHLDPPHYSDVTHDELVALYERPLGDGDTIFYDTSPDLGTIAESEAVRRGEDVDQTMRDSVVTAGWDPSERADGS
jgi:hypothetical protein